VIVTVTANPSVDQTLRLDVFVHQGVNRVQSSLREPSGKGVNVSLALQTAGIPTTAVLPLGGATGAELRELLAATALPVRVVPIAGAVRVNLSLVEADGSTTKVNEPGPRLSEAEVACVVDEAVRATGPGDWLAYCGSLPTGFTAAHLGEAIRSARQAGRTVVVDTSEAPLLTLLGGSADRLPTVVKPNSHELASATGRSIRTLGDVVAAGQVLLDRGVETVLVSLGSDGALLLDQRGGLHGVAPVPRVVNTVGAGDSFLAGYLCARHHQDGAREEALATALRWGAIAVQHHGTVFPGLDPAGPEIAVRLGPVDLSHPLDDPAG
jgi:1-phosphofructokinase